VRTGRLESKGRWSRVRSRTSDILDECHELNSLEVNTLYEFTVGEHSDDACISMYMAEPDRPAQSRLSIAAARGLASDTDRMADLLISELSRVVNPKWGAIFLFPLEAGASFYQLGMTFVGDAVKRLGPSGLILKEHEQRIRRRACEHRNGIGTRMAMCAKCMS
jgi:hypothetical protein